jgi:hypothetical protein
MIQNNSGLPRGLAGGLLQIFDQKVGKGKEGRLRATAMLIKPGVIVPGVVVPVGVKLNPPTLATKPAA